MLVLSFNRGTVVAETIADVQYGTLEPDGRLKPLETRWAPLHGYGIARRIEQVARGSLALNQGTIYPALRAARAAEAGSTSDWGTSENNRRARLLLDHPVRPEAACRRDRNVNGETVAIVTRLLEHRP